MTEQEAYKIGFLMRCADEQLTSDQIKVRIKEAAVVAGGLGIGLAAIITSLGSVVPNFVNASVQAGSATAKLMSGGWIPGWTRWLAAGVPPIAGGTAGYLLGRLPDDRYDPEETQVDEQIDAYHRAATQLRSGRARRVAGKST